MLIGELSRKTGLSRDTIRFYEKRGLIKAKGSDNPYNNYKNYTEDVLQRLLAIRKIKHLGLTLNETAGLLDLIEWNRASCDTVLEQVTGKIALIDKRIQELTTAKQHMLSLVSGCNKTKEGNCPSLSA